MSTYSHTFTFTLTEAVLYVACLVLLLWNLLVLAHAIGRLSGLTKGHAMALEFYTTALALMTQESAVEEEAADTNAASPEAQL